MGNESQSVYARALRRAADILGGKDVLRAALHVPMHSLEEWLNGRSEPPTDVFLKAVDILSTPTGSAPATAATLRARSLSRASGELIRNAERTVAHSRALSDAHHSAVAQQKLLAGFLVATFWVENGKIVAPVTPMRFDDSVYRMLGESLVDFTRERELLPDSWTYGERQTGSARLPGALLSALRFTL